LSLIVVVTLVGTLATMSGRANASTGTIRHVATTGSDAGSCLSKPCATIDYAIGQASAGDTIKVARGSYHQTVQITKPIRLLGSGSNKTTLNGSGLDPGGSFYGVVYVGTTGGAVTVSGFTITNPFPYAYTSGEPEVVALIDQNSSDSVTITKNVISEGSSDPTASTDFPIGIDTFKNAATTTISHNTITGTFQGALLEDNGPASVSNNLITNLISGTDSSTMPPTVYPGEGVFFLSDLSGSITGQNASHNRLSGYGGWGIIMEAGYSNGNCTTTPCNGSIAGSVSHNRFALKGATEGGTGTSAIDMKAEFAGNNLTATVSFNRGYVTNPSQGITTKAQTGATIAVTQTMNKIVVHP
jgi:hypothetical protein